MEVIEPVETMRNICARLQRDGKQIRFVPTMGSLHQGHCRLIERAASTQLDPSSGGGDSGRSGPLGVTQFSVIVSIFVNPTQFNSRQDFVSYPKSFEADLEICRRLKCVDYVFAPECCEMYAGDALQSASHTCRVKPPANCAAQELEGSSRPGHFEGMLTIVCKLFNIIQPDRAYFGEKDYQQLLLVSAMVKDLSMKTRICPVETVREKNTNLPLSSRNARLTDEQLSSAAVMYDILKSAKDAVELKCSKQTVGMRGVKPTNCNNDLDAILLSSRLVAQCLNETTNKHDDNQTDSTTRVDYLELRCAKDLTVIKFNQSLGLYDCAVGCVTHNKQRRPSENVTDILQARLLISIIVAKTRLLDNMEVKLNL